MMQGKADIMEDSSISRFFNRQLEKWADARHRFRDLKHVETRQLSELIKLQWNPARIVSTGAKIDKKTLGERPCFLCAANRPEEQMVPASISIRPSIRTMARCIASSRFTAN